MEYPFVCVCVCVCERERVRDPQVDLFVNDSKGLE